MALNIVGIEATMRFTVVINIARARDPRLLRDRRVRVGRPRLQRCSTNIPPEEGGTTFLPFGIGGIFPAIPFAIWFFLAIEELPLAAEESHDPERDIPRATIWG